MIARLDRRITHGARIGGHPAIGAPCWALELHCGAAPGKGEQKQSWPIEARLRAGEGRSAPSGARAKKACLRERGTLGSQGKAQAIEGFLSHYIHACESSKSAPWSVISDAHSAGQEVLSLSSLPERCYPLRQHPRAAGPGVRFAGVAAGAQGPSRGKKETAMAKFLSDEWFAKVQQITEDMGDIEIPGPLKDLTLNLTVTLADGTEKKVQHAAAASSARATRPALPSPCSCPPTSRRRSSSMPISRPVCRLS